ncbi:21516_t:CDS:2 [Dentiscutata erythropus]|uniref:21516_t:CDS:1 n=1 Tax=Dentiscutata erythropus TaxID=1348616 RepID=A0A9N9JRV5_9GLOM|nr:21516_t:CDS:2 [Dentiscutata erythropus]
MNHSTNHAQPQNNGQLQGSYNVSGPQNAGGLFQRTLNTGTHSRPQNTVNIIVNTFIDVQRYIDLVEGTDPFTKTQGIENSQSQDVQFSTLLISGEFQIYGNMRQHIN